MYPMVNREDVPYSPDSLDIGRDLLLAEIIFVKTKRALEANRPKTTTNGINCSESDWKDAMRKLISKKRPVGGWPKDAP